MSGKEKTIQYLKEFLGMGLTIVICYGIYRWGAGNEKACFAITLGAVAYLLLCFFNAIFKNSFKSMIQRILSGIMVIVYASELYDYNNLIAVFPVLKNIEPTRVVIILLGGVLAVLIIIKLMIYIYENSDNNSNSVPKPIRGEHKTKEGDAWLLLYMIFLIVIVGGVVSLFTAIYEKGLLEQNFDFIGVVTFLVKYAGSVVMFLLAVVIVLVIFIELIRMIIARLKIITITLKNEEQNDAGPLYLLSVVICFLVCYFTYKSTGIDMESFVGFVNDGKYLALPLTVVFLGVAFVIFLRLTHATLVLLVDMKSERVKGLLKEVNEKTKITKRLAEIIRIIIDVILETVLTALKFVQFIPNFFGIVYSFVLEDEEDFEDEEDDVENESEVDADKNKNKEKKKNSQRTGTAIIRVAAFAFAVVSCYATAEGLNMYVFDQEWQAVLISFAIQSILFVLNLKLPAYYHRIGEKCADREKKKYWFGTKRGDEKNAYKSTTAQKLLCSFYLVVLLSSSFFSFVYICNHVVYDHQSGYADDNTILSSEYRKILNDTDDYIEEYKTVTRILASKLLGELKEEYPVSSTANVKLEELENKVSDAQNTLEIAEDEYEQAKNDVEAAEKEKEGYQDSRNNTYRHTRQDEWQEKFEKAEEDYEKLLGVRDTKQGAYKDAKTALTNAIKAVNSYKKSQDTVITAFLIEMLKEDCDPNKLNQCIDELNDMIVDLGKSGEVVDNYSDLAGKTQVLSAVANNYITLNEATNDSDNNSIEYLRKHVMDNVTVPDPKSDSFKVDCTKWRVAWGAKLETLEDTIQQLPKFSNSEKSYMEDEVINLEILTGYVADEKIDKINDLRRNKISDINPIEKAVFLLQGKYKFTAWFAAALAIFFDLCSLLVGLFLFWIQKKEPNKNDL